MVTGSHIPEDRNGIKFNKPTGEILKTDERGISSQTVELNEGDFDTRGNFNHGSNKQRPVVAGPARDYAARYLDFFGANSLSGMRVGVYQHSAVGRDLLVEILSGLGAKVTPLGRSETFIPVDTEAIRPEDLVLARQWAGEEKFDAIVSADGDSDRPLISDEQGRWLRGDIAGILCARFLGADIVCTPVSCNTAVEKCGWFKQVRRTRIGSPYVIGAMAEDASSGGEKIVGYEANGGFLIASQFVRRGNRLRPLPTRDAVIVIASILTLAKEQGKKISELLGSLPQRHTASDRLKNFPTEDSKAILAGFDRGSEETDRRAIERTFGPFCGEVANIDRTDGLRITFANSEIVHLRPSGNAPEFRCYTEASSENRALSLNGAVLGLLGALARQRQA